MFGEKRLKDVYVGATRWEVFKFRVARTFKRTLWTSLAVVICGWMVYGGSVIGSRHIVTVYAEQEVPVMPDVPVLDRIAKCESSTGQYGKDGQISLHPNANSVDIGSYQINEKTWGVQATKMGFDLTKPADNKAMAEWIYLNYGTGSWTYSESCWDK